MTASRCFELLLLGSLGCVAALGLIRALLLRSHGVRLVAIDPKRSITQGLTDLAQVVALLFWWYAAVAYAWPLAAQPVPSWLGTVLIDTPSAKAAGVVLSLIAVVIYALALHTLGDSWRLGIDRRKPGPLVTNGIFAWTRNPIYVSLDLLLLGAFLVEGRLILLLLALANAPLFHLLIEREESFLAEIYGEPYRRYRRRVGRYVGRW
jgi:protein-S-isoprenylcysteine O-methyltransferase Ste14